MDYRELYQADLQRYGSGIDSFTKKWLKLFRKTQTENNAILKHLLHKYLLHHGRKHGIEIDYPVKIGKGFYIGHPYGITINDSVVIGNNCNIHKGVTIGQENRGKRKGTPVIGNMVWIGVNSTIVGNVTIGDDVLIAPNTYVNCDVPEHSVVFGNPCTIKNKECATEHYINSLFGV